jgi:hypothetical protein
MNYSRSPFRHWRTENSYGPVKVSVAITKDDCEGTGIVIRSQCLSDKEVSGWDLVKTLNGQHLYRMDAHYSSGTFEGIIELLNQFADDIYKEM